MGKINNQKFVQIPSAKLKNRIEKLCKQYKIQFVETEESYTSKASFLDGDMLPTESSFVDFSRIPTARSRGSIN
jgi:putative transposase